MSVIFGPGAGRSVNLSACGVPETQPIRVCAIPGQVTNLMEFLNSSGSVVASIDTAGVFTGGLSPADLAAAVILAPASVSRNLIQPTTDANKGLVLKAHSPTQTAALIEAQTSAGTVFFSASSQAGSGPNKWVCADPNSLISIESAPSQAGSPFQIIANKTVTGNTLSLVRISSDASVFWELETDPGMHDPPFLEDVCRIIPEWANSTDAAYKGRMRFECEDVNADFPGREFLRGEATGAAAAIGFLGAAAIVRPGATVDLRQALINLGLYTTGGATPLDLNGGALTTSGAASLGATTLTGDVTLSTHNLITDVVTGTKIGTATTQKLGFFNAAPVAQQVGASAAGIGAIIDPAAQTAITALQTALANLGFVTSPA